jgi:hypothetical protein
MLTLAAGVDSLFSRTNPTLLRPRPWLRRFHAGAALWLRDHARHKRGGIWQAGQGLAAAASIIYLLTGNSTDDSASNPGAGLFASAALKLSPLANGLIRRWRFMRMTSHRDLSFANMQAFEPVDRRQLTDCISQLHARNCLRSLLHL